MAYLIKIILIMKNSLIFYVFLIFLFSNHAFSQEVLVEEGFEDIICPDGLADAFYDGCVVGGSDYEGEWISTHGTSNITTDVALGNIQPYEGDFFTHMYVKFAGFYCPEEPHRGEGIALNYDFEQGKLYKISYAIRKFGRVNEAYWILTNGLQNQHGSASNCASGEIIPDVPSGSRFLDYHPLTTSWQFIEETFTPLENFSQLWFRAKNHSEGASNETNGDVYIDAIKIECVCPIESVQFHFEHENGAEDNVFNVCEDIFVNATGTTNSQNSYFMDILELDEFGNIVGYNLLDDPSHSEPGWTFGDPGNHINITEVFAEEHTNNSFSFTPGHTYIVKIALWINDCGGWNEVTHEFTIELGNCCDDFDTALFGLNVLDNLNSISLEVHGFEAYNNMNAMHEWFIYSRPDGSTGTLTPVHFMTTTGVGPHTIYETGEYGLEYVVIHKVTTDCGEICYSKDGDIGENLVGNKNAGTGSVVDCSITDDFPYCGSEPFAAPTSLSVQGFFLSWDAVPNAVGYIISSPGLQIYESCTCKFPVSLNLIKGFLIKTRE